MEKTQGILIVAGEASGDAHAAALVAQLKALNPSLRFFGLGGKLMQEQGVEVQHDIVSLAVIGFFEVLKHYKQLHAIFHGLLASLDRRRPSAAILVDYPGFNLRLAQELARRRIPVYYYISPQIWAWGKGRIHAIKRDVTRMLVLFAFEKTLYEKAGVPVTFVGHPLLDSTAKAQDPAACRSRLGLEPGLPVIALVPGSRTKEVSSLLPVMLGACEKLHTHYNGKVQFILLAAPSVKPAVFERALRPSRLAVVTIDGMDHAALRASDFALVCSGTATLETAILGTPLAVLYKVNLLTWLIGRALIRIPYIGLVNVVAGKPVCEEFIQMRCRAENIFRHMRDFLGSTLKQETMRRELQEVKQALGDGGAPGAAGNAGARPCAASHKAAAAIAAGLKKHSHQA